MTTYVSHLDGIVAAGLKCDRCGTLSYVHITTWDAIANQRPPGQPNWTLTHVKPHDRPVPGYVNVWDLCPACSLGAEARLIAPDREIEAEEAE